MTRVTFQHHFDDELEMFVFTSPEVKSFRATGKTIEEAERAAVALMSLVRKDRPERVTHSVEYVSV